MRFDFSCDHKLTDEEKIKTEEVNKVPKAKVSEKDASAVLKKKAKMKDCSKKFTLWAFNIKIEK